MTAILNKHQDAGYQDSSDFLAPANTEIDLTTFIFNTQQTPLPQVPFSDFRSAYQETIPLARNERFPDSFALSEGEVSLSRIPLINHTFIPELNLFVLNRHLPLLKLIISEISDPIFTNLAHGTATTYNKRCPGPLCRRAKRIKEQETSLLRKYRQSYKDNPNTRVSLILTDPRARYASLRVRSKRYSGPEPLQFIYSARELARTPRTDLSKYEQHLLKLITQNLLYPYMLSVFTPDIQ
jgi:hypothetical protein